MSSNLKYFDDYPIFTTSKYLRNSKIIGVIWAIFTGCYVVISTLAFFAPEWIGHEDGKVGLFSVCVFEEHKEICRGKLDNFVSYPGSTFQATTVFVALGVFTAALTICAMLFFLCCHSSTVFFTCAWMQLFSGTCILAGCVTFPLGWNEETVQSICANSDKYLLGQCDIKYGFILAVIGSLDGFVLCILAFILATRYINLTLPDSTNFYQGEMNAAYLDDSASFEGSRKSLSLHPVLFMHPDGQEDTYSQFSQRTCPRSIHSVCYSHNHLPYSAHGFQI